MKRFVICIGFTMCLYVSGFSQVKDSVVYRAGLLIEADSMPVNGGQLLVLPNQGLFIIDGKTLYSLDKNRCSDIERLRLLESFPIDHVIVNDNELIVKSQQFLMALGEKETKIVAEFDTENFAIFPGNDSIVNIIIQENDTSVWHKYDRRTGETECVLRQKEPIRKIVAGNHIDFCIIGNNVYYVKDIQCEELIVSEQPVTDIILLPNGLMFCTENMLSLITNDRVTPMLEGNFHGLLNDGSVVYAVLKNGNIWRLEQIDVTH